MTTSISPELDVYGTYARVSAIADWLEIAAWHSRRVTRAQLEDLFYDNNWTTLKPQQFVIGEPSSHEANDESSENLHFSNVPELWSDAVHSVLQERASLLADGYPFRLQGDWQLLTKPSATKHSPYMALLCITVAHAWKLPTRDDPKVLIEETVARALAEKGWQVAPMGTGDRKGLSFQENLIAVGLNLGLPVLEPAIPSKLHAKDGGVDTLTFVGWRDFRQAGQWISIGQVTITKSDRWEAKIQEPRRDHWAGYFIQPVFPARFLAVPHHVERHHLEHLAGESTGTVIDRLRLCSDLTSVSDAEKRLVDEVLEFPVEDGRSAT